MQTFLDVGLELDEDGLVDERGGESASVIVGDRDLRLLLRRNRIALARSAPIRLDGGDGVVGYDISLTCVVHSDPRCRFRWSRLMVDLASTPGALITDMVPREVTDDQPVELTTTVGLGLKFNVVANVLGAEAAPQFSQKRTVYYPNIVSSGSGFTRGFWDFLALGNQYLHADRELRLLVTAPPETPLDVRFQLRAKVRLAGVAGVIPLLARGGAIDSVHRLTL